MCMTQRTSHDADECLHAYAVFLYVSLIICDKQMSCLNFCNALRCIICCCRYLLRISLIYCLDWCVFMTFSDMERTSDAAMAAAKHCLAVYSLCVTVATCDSVIMQLTLSNYKNRHNSFAQPWCMTQTQNSAACTWCTVNGGSLPLCTHCNSR